VASIESLATVTAAMAPVASGEAPALTALQPIAVQQSLAKWLAKFPTTPIFAQTDRASAPMYEAHGALILDEALEKVVPQHRQKNTGVEALDRALGQTWFFGYKGLFVLHSTEPDALGVLRILTHGRMHVVMTTASVLAELMGKRVSLQEMLAFSARCLRRNLKQRHAAVWCSGMALLRQARCCTHRRAIASMPTNDEQVMGLRRPFLPRLPNTERGPALQNLKEVQQASVAEPASGNEAQGGMPLLDSVISCREQS
jgi:hypothetical protein